MKSILKLGLVLLATAIPQVAGAREYVSPKFRPRERPVRKVLVLPPQVQMTKDGMKGQEGMAKESEQMAEQIMALIVKQLEGRNVRVMPNPFTEEALKNDEELQAALLKIQNKYDTISTQLHSKPKDVRKARYTIGDEVATLGPAAEADAIVFIRGSGSVLTGGKKAFGLLVQGHFGNTIRTFVSFADSRSGDILAIVDFQKGGDFQKNSEKIMSKTLTNSFKKIPFSTE